MQKKGRIVAARHVAVSRCIETCGGDLLKEVRTPHEEATFARSFAHVDATFVANSSRLLVLECLLLFLWSIVH